MTLSYVYLRILSEVTAFSSSCHFSNVDLECSIARLTQFKVSRIATKLTLDSIFLRVHEESGSRQKITDGIYTQFRLESHSFAYLTLFRCQDVIAHWRFSQVMEYPTTAFSSRKNIRVNDRENTLFRKSTMDHERWALGLSRHASSLACVRLGMVVLFRRVLESWLSMRTTCMKTNGE